ncbi:outer membrane protein assembly factor BamA [Sulfurospirillum sp. 1612]|uniref:outer membrane protein assembly factor BamA n=1 Tax=Sulfurospirillum sp. 1612 TaxID=3094835 RepID=UPI002F92CA29
MKKLLLSGFMVFSSLYAVDIKSIKFDGLIHLSPSVALEIMNISKGDPIDIEVIDKGIKALYKQNYFKDISVEDDNNGNLTISVVEKPVIANIDITGISDSDKKDLKDALGVKKGEIYSLSKLNTAKRNVEKYYEDKGYFDTVVEATTKNLNKTSLSLNLIVNRGEKIVIKKVTLCGAKNFDYSDVRASIANRQEEYLSWMWGFDDGELKVKDLIYDSARIRDYYMRHGYLDAHVSNPFLKAYMDGYFAKLTYNIKEGEKYNVGTLSITSPQKIVDTKKILAQMQLQKGEVFNSKKLRNDLKTIENAFGDKGYAFVRVNPDVKTDKKNHIANINFIVDPGDKVYIHDVRISGNTKTIDRVVRREIFLAAGDLYNKTDLEDSRTALKRTGYFDDASIKEVRVSQDKVDLLVTIKEARTSSIGGGIGYGSTDGLILSASLADGNIFGSGMKANVSVERSNSILSGAISLTNPRVNDSIYSLSGTVYRQNYDYTSYDLKNLGFNLTVGRKFGRQWSGSVGYTLQESELSNLDDSIDASLYKLGTTIKSAVTPAVSYNSTDDYYLPRKGISAKASIEIAGLGGDDKFITFRNKFEYFYGLQDVIDYDLILRYRAKFNYIVDNGYLPIDEKLYMGGTSTVRGYSSNTISPKNSSDALLGGRMMFANSVEASFPLIERIKLRGAVFFDYGMIGEDSLNIKRAGTGVTLEWNSPLGAINLIFAKALLNESGDDLSSFEFTMGQRF